MRAPKLVGRALAEGRRLLECSEGPAERREATLLLAKVLGWTEAQVLARDDRVIERAAWDRYSSLVARRAAGEPFAYLFGRREFWGRTFHVDDRVLVPRPETEHLVEACLSLPLPPSPRALDVGTGSGAIAVTLSLEMPDSRVTATDRSLDALAVARTNARRLQASISLVRTDLVAGLDLGAFDLVVSNPPYLPRDHAAQLPIDVRDFEPAEALFGGDSGLETIERLLADLAGVRAGTSVVFEVGDGQGESVMALLEQSGFADRRTLPDYAGTPRVVIGTRSSWTGSRS